MTNILDGLLERIEDPSLRAALKTEVDRLRNTKDFGLVFEKHLPENVRLYSHPVRRGLRVEERSGKTDSTWLVRRVREGKATLVDADGQKSERPVEELVVVRQFGEPIYPGLKSVGRIERGGDKPFHTVINGENYHALETLLYAYEGKVDCIYIDPPYNTGAKDWKYNNDYVAADDAYRHSKWLSFMERRLELAKRLLNPEDSVLIVTIDEKEYLRIGMLLEQMFPSAKMQMVSSVISRNGTSREGEFSRVEEYLFMVRLGQQAIVRSNDNMLGEEGASAVSRIWFSFMRTSTPREALEGQFYPVIIDTEHRKVVRIGEPAGRGNVPVDPHLGTNEVAVWPIRQDGATATWGAIVPTARELLREGYLRVGGFDARTGRWSLHFVREGDRERVASGVIQVTGTRPDGSKDLEYVDLSQRESYPKTIWNRVSHDATSHGTRLLKELLPGRRFPYPKALYAVEDTLRFFVARKPNAVIVDFFGGSGTTAHAVMRLNRQDGGSRRSIVVTNNEVSVDEAMELREKGLSPGDPAWEAKGIFQHITTPRIEAAVTGVTHTGEPVKGNYKFTDEFPMADGFDENVEFVELTYLDRNDVSRGKSFEAIAPLLWMKVGSRGEMIAKQKSTFDAPKGARYAVLFDIDVWPKFIEAIRGREDLQHVFIVTDSLAMYQQVVAELPVELETTMLYEDYLRNFEINMGGAQ